MVSTKMGSKTLSEFIYGVPNGTLYFTRLAIFIGLHFHLKKHSTFYKQGQYDIQYYEA